MSTTLIVALVIGVLIVLTRKSTTSSTTSQGGGKGSPPNARTQAIAEAIAHAEGYYAAGNPLPSRNNNPGDILDASGNNIAYATSDDGWNALYHQIALILNDSSHVYNSSMSIAQIAGLWTGGDNPGPWGQTVAQNLGLSITDPLTAVSA